MAVPPNVPALHGQVALVTGAARGQGRSHCLALAEAGADVVALDVCRDLEIPAYPLGTEAELDQVVEEVERHDRRCLRVIADVRDDDEVRDGIALSLDTFGRLDVLVNNAAVVTSAPFWELSNDEWQAVIDTDLTGVWRVAKHAAEAVRASPRGRIVNVASTVGHKAIGDFAHYVAAKHGVVGLTRAMAIELAPFGVTVNAVVPGAVDSPMLGGLADELGLTPDDVHELFLNAQLFDEVLRPEEMSAALLWLLSPAADRVTGHCLAVDGGSLAT